ncbi:LytR/AlgR family response regulator transcription factor [Anaerosporobacter faecicola]|uniref:LytR/AlgR family response regulator transcription factor n=1 Tax=Anaerosporobacter faecicola TaxID=2718714 RepID=UPI001EE58318|nr:LytTR family DNA-binding domain-containing protein [Anaerosporobacter faecicola]
MLICGYKEEGSVIEKVVRNTITCYHPQDWNIDCCEEMEQAREILQDKEKVDFSCLDLTRENAIELAEFMRKKFPDMVLLIIADDTISPMTYLRPSIMAASLLLRPYEEQQLHQALQEMFRYALKEMLTEEEDTCFTMDISGENFQVAYASILYFESRLKKIFVVTGEEEYGFYGTMNSLEDALPENFVRCHRGFIINVDRMEKINRKQHVIMLDDGSQIPTSRSYQRAIKERLA